MYKKVVKFSFKQQKIIWVLVFSFIYLVLVDAKERSLILKNLKDNNTLTLAKAKFKFESGTFIRKCHTKTFREIRIRNFNQNRYLENGHESKVIIVKVS